MRVLYRRCCGIDVHKDGLTACILVIGDDGKREVRKKEFRTFLEDLRHLKTWLRSSKVEYVAMESTGVYWKPVWNVLEGHFPLLLANPYHMRNIPGRKTDQNDAEWIADLLAHGLLKPSFVPSREIRDLRDLTRHRVKLVEERARVHNRIAKVLEDANLKLGSVASDILGKSGRAMLDRIAAGLNDTVGLAYTRYNRLHADIADVRKALNALVTDHHRWMLRCLLSQIDAVDGYIQQVEQEIVRRMEPYDATIARLITVPGFDIITAWTLIAELGPDMSAFADAAHAASWAGLVPGNFESAGKRKSTRTRHGNVWLRRALCQSAWAVTRKKNCAVTAFFLRHVSRHGMKKAIVATAHRLLIIAFHVVRDGGVYRELGGDLYDRLNPERTVNRLKRRLERLGVEVAIRFPEVAASVPPLKKRGRPCKCRERGLRCPHGRVKTEDFFTQLIERPEA
jgi:transposase